MSRRAKQIQRAANTTVLLVGEGDTEKAFLEHLKTLYVTRGCGVSVTIRNAHGKGPENVVDVAIRQARGAAYSMVGTLMDTDLPWTPPLRKLARLKKICLVGSSPCCDGLLLKLLGEGVPTASVQCKTKLFDHLGRKPVTPEAYRTYFTKELLEEKRGDVAALEKLLTLMTGIKPESD